MTSDNREEQISIIHSFNKYFLSDCHVLDTVLGSGDSEGNKTHSPLQFTFKSGDRKWTYINKYSWISAVKKTQVG